MSTPPPAGPSPLRKWTRSLPRCISADELPPIWRNADRGVEGEENFAFHSKHTGARHENRAGQGQMNEAFEKKVRAAAAAGWWVILIAVGFLTFMWLMYLAVMSAQPAW